MRMDLHPFNVWMQSYIAHPLVEQVMDVKKTIYHSNHMYMVIKQVGRLLRTQVIIGFSS
jgi:hypothetical protein